MHPSVYIELFQGCHERTCASRLLATSRTIAVIHAPKYSIEDAAQFNLASSDDKGGQQGASSHEFCTKHSRDSRWPTSASIQAFLPKSEMSLFLLCHLQIEIRSCPPFTVESVIMEARLCTDKAFSRQSE